jgi:UDP-N-acetylmuramyl pentapeptide synthase
MRELGEYSEAEHRKLMAQAAQSADEVYLIGPQMSKYGADELIKLGYNQQHIHAYLSSLVAGEALLLNINQREKRSLILFK